jgi:hypothetical protein
MDFVSSSSVVVGNLIPHNSNTLATCPVVDVIIKYLSKADSARLLASCRDLTALGYSNRLWDDISITYLRPEQIFSFQALRHDRLAITNLFSDQLGLQRLCGLAVSPTTTTWNVETLASFQKSITFIASLPNKNLVVKYADTVQLLSSTGRRLNELADNVSCVTVLSTGSVIVAICNEPTMHIFSATGDLIKTVTLNEPIVELKPLTQDTFATRSQTGYAGVWSALDGQLLDSSEPTEGTVVFTILTRGNKPQFLELPAAVSCLATLPDDSVAMGSTMGHVLCPNTENPSQAFRDGDSEESCAVNELMVCNAGIASRTAGGVVRVWSDDGLLLEDVGVSTNERFTCLTTMQGGILAMGKRSGHVVLRSGAHEIATFNPRQAEELFGSGRLHPMTSIVALPNGSILTGTSSGRLCQWSPDLTPLLAASGSQEVLRQVAKMA